jgi:hypothetical protein
VKQGRERERTWDIAKYFIPGRKQSPYVTPMTRVAAYGGDRKSRDSDCYGMDEFEYR